MLPSVVCTPETAGGDIEYAWEKLKYEQRQQNDSAAKLEAGAKFIARVKTLCQDESILPSSRVWKYERRARDYIRLYLDVSDRRSQSSLTHKGIEAMRTKQKTHRNIMEIEREFVRNNLSYT